jgi:hypothetical protein
LNFIHCPMEAGISGRMRGGEEEARAEIGMGFFF